MKDILLIEDNADDVELARRAFDKAGLADKVYAAPDGEIALDYLFGRGAFAENPGASFVQLILLDLNLPKAPGLEVLRQIRLSPSTRHIPVVVLTVSKKEPDLLQSFTMGIVDYLIKPLDPERFSQIYRKYVRSAST